MIVDSDFYAIVLRYELHESMENQIEVLKPRTDMKRNLCEVFGCIMCYHFPCERRLIKYETYQQ